MPRIARGETVGGIYHIINRGNMKVQVFDDTEDYEYFLELLEIATKREKVEIHAYCLMPNHFHLLLDVNQPLREGELENIRNSVNRQAPLGQEQWQMETATKYGLLSTLRKRGTVRLFFFFLFSFFQK